MAPYWVSDLGLNTRRLLRAPSTSRLMLVLFPLQLKCPTFKQVGPWTAKNLDAEINDLNYLYLKALSEDEADRNPCCHKWSIDPGQLLWERTIAIVELSNKRRQWISVLAATILSRYLPVVKSATWTWYHAGGWRSCCSGASRWCWTSPCRAGGSWSCRSEGLMGES